MPHETALIAAHRAGRTAFTAYSDNVTAQLLRRMARGLYPDDVECQDAYRAGFMGERNRELKALLRD